MYHVRSAMYLLAREKISYHQKITMPYAWNHIIVLSSPRSENFDAIIKIPLIYRPKKWLC